MGKNTGGPAFPEMINVAHKTEWETDSGMTLRDYFAAKAMQSITQSTFCDCEAVAKMSYAVADAMIAERNKK